MTIYQIHCHRPNRNPITIYATKDAVESGLRANFTFETDIRILLNCFSGAFAFGKQTLRTCEGDYLMVVNPIKVFV